MLRRSTRTSVPCEKIHAHDFFITHIPLGIFVDQARGQKGSIEMIAAKRPVAEATMASLSYDTTVSLYTHQPRTIPARLPAKAAPIVLALSSITNFRSLTDDFSIDPIVHDRSIINKAISTRSCCSRRGGPTPRRKGGGTQQRRNASAMLTQLLTSCEVAR